MRATVRSLGIVGFVLVCVFAIGWATPLATVVRLLGTTALIMGGTQHPLINPNNRLNDYNGMPSYGFSEPGLVGADGLPTGYVADAMGLIRRAGPSDEEYSTLAVWSPEAFWPVFGSDTFNASVRKGVGNLDTCIRSSADCTAHVYAGADDEPDGFSVFAYSQSARIASLQKARLIDEYNADDPGTQRSVSFVMIGNPNRPNGGILQRFKGLYIPILDVSFDGASPTDGPVVDGKYLYPTVDIARQYDGWTDFPAYPLNLLAALNAFAGILFVHPDYFVGTASNPVATQPYLYQGQVGDTNYYMVATKRLPLLVPLTWIGVPAPILAALDAPLRAFIEMGYNRTVSPGDPTGARIFRPFTPVRDLLRLVVAVFTGLDDAVSMICGDPDARPFGTKPVQSAFGVGGAVLPTAPDAVPPTPPLPAAAPDVSVEPVLAAEPELATARTAISNDVPMPEAAPAAPVTAPAAPVVESAPVDGTVSVDETGPDDQPVSRDETVPHDQPVLVDQTEPLESPEGAGPEDEGIEPQGDEEAGPASAAVKPGDDLTKAEDDGADASEADKSDRSVRRDDASEDGESNRSMSRDAAADSADTKSDPGPARRSADNDAGGQRDSASSDAGSAPSGASAKGSGSDSAD